MQHPLGIGADVQVRGVLTAGMCCVRVAVVAGVLAASRGTGAFDTSLMQQVLVFAFAAAALGGFDSPLGAVVGGLIVGVADALTIQYVDFLDGIEIVVPFALILGVLLVRPNGLFGRNIVERV